MASASSLLTAKASPPEFHEVQYFRQPWIVVTVFGLGAIAVAVLAWGAYTQLVEGHPFGDQPMSDTALAIVAPCLIVLILATMVFMWHTRLVTETRDDGLYVRYHWLFVNRLIPYGEIARCEARTYRPILEYGGWGIRWSLRNGKAYNVCGNRGVQLELADGKRLLIGSQRANELAEAINARRESLSA